MPPLDPEILLLGLICGLLVVPRALQRFRIRSARAADAVFALHENAGFVPREGALETPRCGQAYYLDL